MCRLFQFGNALLTMSVLFVGCTNRFDKDLEAFVKEPIHIPYQTMDKRVCSIYTDTLSSEKMLRIVNYIDTLDCSTCALSRLAAVEKEKKDLDELKDVGFVYVIETDTEKAENVYFAFCNARIEGAVYLDTCHAFLRANPHIPDDPLFHTFVLNEQDSVVLVGDPFKNEKMEKLLLKVIEKEKQRRKKDKTIRA